MAKGKTLAVCLGLVVLLPFSGLLPFVGTELVLASPDELKWSVVDSPSKEGNVVVSPSEINAFVIGSDEETFYAVDIPNGIIYKSIDAGVTWEDDLTQALEDEGATLPAWDIAVAPHDPELVAVVTNSRQEVYVSEDGGESWENTHISAAAGWSASLLISDIAISPEYGGERDIAIGTRNPDGSSNGDIWVIKSELLASWKAQGLDTDVTSVCFSPDYDSDKTILVIASDIEKTYLCTGIRDTDENNTDWEVTDPPEVEISESSGDSPGESEIIFSDLALPSDYSGDEPESRVVYAAYSSNTTADDVYRIEDTDVFRLDVNRGSKVSVASIAYYGTCSGGKLLVGEVLAEADSASALIHLCFNPEEIFPDWEEPAKPPTGGAVSGNANAQVVWSSDGKVAYCGTSSNNVTSAAEWKEPAKWDGQLYDESAFSKSEYGGDIWNQLSLIDTEMSKLCDYALSADYETLYLASEGSEFDSIWRSESETLEALGEIWQRVLCFDSETDNIILRSTPEDSPEEAIFLAVRDSDDASYSLDKGETWKRVWQCPHITDLAVVSNELLYILDDNLLNKGTWKEKKYGGIWGWDRDLDTGLISGHTIATSGEDFVFIGDEGDEGKVAYSADGGDTFELTEALPEPGKMWVIPDEEFDSNRFIYAASDDSSSGIYRWVIEGSTSWRELNPRETGFYGLAEKGGALYGAYGSGVVRTLIPHLETVEESDWDSLTVGLASGLTFRASSLRAMSNEAIDLWAIDDRDYYNGFLDPDEDEYDPDVGRLWVYSDTFVLRAPWPTSPAIGGLISCDPCYCQARIFLFRWRELPLTEEYELWIALDEEFNYVVAKAENITPANLGSPAWCSPASSFRFVCGKTYYWKVRGCATTEGESIHSRWSPPMHFTVKTCSSIEGMHIAPILKVPPSGSRAVSRSPSFSWLGFPHATKYEFILAKDADLTQVVIKEEVPISAYIYSAKLDWDTTYFWRVKAIEPVPSEPSVISAFTVMPEPQPVTPAIVPVTLATPFWIWLIIGILALLDIVIIVFCLVRR